MRRWSFVPLLLLGCACSKSAGPKEKPDEGLGGGGDRIAVPGGARGGPGAEGASTGSPGDDKRQKLLPEEGTLAIEASAAKAGAETVVHVTVTPTDKYKVNVEFPTKLTLQNTDGVTIAKPTLAAGGMDKEKGDAETFEEGKLAFAVKLTPAKSGSYTINGSFKFAVCDRAGSTCLAKKEPIAIQVAAQ